MFSTYLPNNDWLSIATHTFIVVQDSRGKITYAAYGPKHNDPISGNDMLALCEYEPDKKAYTDYLYKHIQNIRIKGVELIPVPQGMTSDEFDARVIDVIHNFGNNPRIKYKLNPTDKDEGNCNSSSSTILLKAGVSGEDVERIGNKLKGIHWGFSSKPKPWTAAEQSKAVKEEDRHREEENKRLDALQQSL